MLTNKISSILLPMRRFLFAFITMLLCISHSRYALEKKNRSILGDVVAVVGDVPITNIDLKNETGFFRKRKGVKKDFRNLNSQVLDLLISRAIVDYVAQQESVHVSYERVNNTIEKEMKTRRIADIEQFKRMIKRSLGISWLEYRKELTRQLKTQQVVQLRVSVPNPTPSQIETWYKLKRRKLGNKYLIRFIALRYNKSSPAEELKISKLMHRVRREARRNFAAAAKKYSNDPSRKRGGLLGWARLDQLYLEDPIIAGYTRQTRKGRVSRIFISKKGYSIIKVEAIRPIPLE